MVFDMTNLIPSFFEVKLPNSVELSVKPPKMSVLKKILTISKSMDGLSSEDGKKADEALRVLTDVLAVALSSNKQDRKVTSEELDGILDIRQLIALFEEYFTWVGKINDSKN